MMDSFISNWKKRAAIAKEKKESIVTDGPTPRVASQVTARQSMPESFVLLPKADEKAQYENFTWFGIPLRRRIN